LRAVTGNGERRIARREFLAGAGAALVPLRAEEAAPVFDIHCHPPFPGHSEGWILRHQRALGIQTSVLLPINSAAAHTGVLPSFNIAKGSAIRMATEYPNEFVAFTLVDPRRSDAARTLRREFGAGARGIGELEFPIDCDSPKLDPIYELAGEFGRPVLQHFEYGAANRKFERFEKVVAKYPRVPFIGHAQTWWGNIDLHHRQEQIWPEPDWRVTPGGITDRLLRDYPNVFGDLSASSGLNALTRDRGHARAFLERHQDKLLFGTDCIHEGPAGAAKCFGGRTLEVLRELAPSQEILRKILWINSRKLLGMPESV